jgi:uncharacterized membrane protein YedE/YeeE
MAVRGAAFAVGVVFGVVMVWSGLSNPDVIRDMLLLKDAYVFLLFVSAVAVAFVGLRLLRLFQTRAVITREPIDLKPERPQRRHVIGSLMFGAGWAIADTCPGPIAAQLGSGTWWGIFTAAGVLAGIALYFHRAGRTARAGAARPTPPAAAAEPLPQGE